MVGSQLNRPGFHMNIYLGTNVSLCITFILCPHSLILLVISECTALICDHASNFCWQFPFSSANSECLELHKFILTVNVTNTTYTTADLFLNCSFLRVFPSPIKAINGSYHSTLNTAYLQIAMKLLGL